MTRHESMIAMATSLARGKFAAISWGATSDGKGPNRHWKADATADHALVPTLLHGSRNALVIPTGRALIIDIDVAAAWDELEAAGLPPTLTIDSPTPDHGHVYGWVPASIDMATIPGTFAHGELRRHDPKTDTASMVLGPWSLRTDGVYTPRGDVRTIATFPESVIAYLIASRRTQDRERSSARGPQDSGWRIAKGRHDYLVGKARRMRGDGLTGDRLLDEVRRLDRERCDPPLADSPGRGDEELSRIVAWVMGNIGDDPPPITIAGVTRTGDPPALDLTIATRTAADLPTLTWAEIMAEPPDPPPVIRPGLPEVGVTVLAGAPKVGKTLLATQWVLESRLRCLFVIEEGSRVGISYRLRVQAAALGVTDPDVHLAHRLRVRLDEPKSVETLRAFIDAEHIDLVVMDPLNRLHSVDENRPSDMTRVMDGMAALAYESQTAILAIHHLSKPSAERRGDIWDRFRGASSIRSGTDANLVMDGTGEHIHLVGEFRDAEPLSEWLELDRESLTFRSVDAPEIPSKVDPAALRAFVELRGQVTARQTVEEFKVSKPTAFAALRALGCDEWAGVRNVLTFSLGTGK